MQELHQEYEGDFVSQVTRVYANSADLEFDFLVGPIPIADQRGKEVVSIYSTRLQGRVGNRAIYLRWILRIDTSILLQCSTAVFESLFD